MRDKELLFNLIMEEQSRDISVDTVSVLLPELPPSLETVHEYWTQCRGNNFAPSWKQFELLNLPAELIPSIQVADWVPEQQRFIYRFYGGDYVEIYKKELTGKSPQDLPIPKLGELVHQQYLSILTDKEPCAIAYGTNQNNTFDLINTCLRLPLSNDGHHVSAIVSVGLIIKEIPFARDIVEKMLSGYIKFNPKFCAQRDKAIQ